MSLTGRPPYQKISPEVKRLDKQYLAWVRTQPSCISGKFSEIVNGKPMNPACHVRTAENAGTSIKPPLSAIPMTHEEHALQHQHGATAVVTEEMINSSPVEFAGEWLLWQADVHLRRWGQLVR